MPRQASPAASCRSCRTLAPCREYQCAAAPLRSALPAELHRIGGRRVRLALAHGGAVPDRMAAETQLASSARAVRPLAAGAPPVLLARGSGVFSTAVLSNRRSRMPPEGEYTNPNQMPWLTRRARTLALRRSAEPELLGSAGTGFARAASAGALGWQSQGPSAAHEGLCLRSPGLTPPSSGQPSAAAHVER